jgi:hypothetical protein
MSKFKHAAAGAAVVMAAAIAPIHAAAADEDTPPGWGMAIAARVIGEKCSGSVENGDILLLNDYIAAQFTKSLTGSGHGPAWWADLRDTLEKSYVEKYSDPANCTDDAREQAEELVAEVREINEDQDDR